MFSQRQEFKLTASELNQLTTKDILTNPNLMVSTGELIIQPYENKDEHSIIYYEILVKDKQKNFILFPMVKDADDFENQPTLHPIKKVVQQFYQDYHKRDCVLLLPMLQCLGYYYVPQSLWVCQRMHSVLVEIDLNNDRKKITVHDSQRKLNSYAYTDHLLSLAEESQFDYLPGRDYHSYGQQAFLDQVSCGYFVYTYIGQILRDGHSKNCKYIYLDIRELCNNKQEYLMGNKIWTWNLNEKNDVEVDHSRDDFNPQENELKDEKVRLDEDFLVLNI